MATGDNNNKIDLSTEVNKGLSIFTRLDQDVIVINTDKVKLLLIEHHTTVKKKMDWITPFGILVTIGATLLTTDFTKSIFGVPKETWQALFIFTGAFCLIWTGICIWNIISLSKKGTVDEFVDNLKIESKKLASNVVEGKESDTTVAKIVF